MGFWVWNSILSNRTEHLLLGCANHSMYILILNYPYYLKIVKKNTVTITIGNIY